MGALCRGPRDAPYRNMLAHVSEDAPTLGHPRGAVDARAAPYDALFKDIEHSRFAYIDPRAALCDAETCLYVETGAALFFDDNHLSRIGAARLTLPLQDALRP